MADYYDQDNDQDQGLPASPQAMDLPSPTPQAPPLVSGIPEERLRQYGMRPVGEPPTIQPGGDQPTYDVMTGAQAPSPSSTPANTNALNNYFARADAMNQQRYDSERGKFDKRDENGNWQMDNGLAHLQILANQANGNDKMSVLQYGAQQADHLRAASRAASDEGHMARSVDLMSDALKYVPNAQHVAITPTSDGVVINDGGRTHVLDGRQWNDLVSHDGLHYDHIMRNGLDPAVEAIMQPRSAVGQEGPGSRPREEGPDYGPTREQIVPRPEARDVDVPAPVGPDGRPLPGYETYGPTKEQVAPGAPPPAAEAPRRAGETPEQYTERTKRPQGPQEPEFRVVQAPTPQRYMQGMTPEAKASFSRLTPQEQRGIIDQQMRLAHPWINTTGQPGYLESNPNYRSPEFLEQERRTAQAQARVDAQTRLAAFERGAAGGQQGTPAIPPEQQTPEQRAAAFERGAAGGAQPAPRIGAPPPGSGMTQQEYADAVARGEGVQPPPTAASGQPPPTAAQAGAQQFRAQTPAWSGGGRIDPTTGRIVLPSGAQPQAVGANDIVTYQGKPMTMAQAREAADKFAAENPMEPGWAAPGGGVEAGAVPTGERAPGTPAKYGFAKGRRGGGTTYLQQPEEAGPQLYRDPNTGAVYAPGGRGGGGGGGRGGATTAQQEAVTARQEAHDDRVEQREMAKVYANPETRELITRDQATGRFEWANPETEKAAQQPGFFNWLFCRGGQAAPAGAGGGKFNPPGGWEWSASRQQYRDPQTGRTYNIAGQPVGQ